MPERVRTPEPDFCSEPDPEITFDTVKSSERLKVKLALLVTLPEPKTPAVDPLPTCIWPAEIVVVVDPLLEPVKVIAPSPTFVKAYAPDIAPLSV